MSKYNNAREQVKKLIASNSFPTDVSIWSEFLKIIDGLEKEDDWLPFDPENIPEAKEGYLLVINHENWANDAEAFNCRGNKWKNGDGTCLDMFDFGTGCQYKLVPLS